MPADDLRLEALPNFAAARREWTALAERTGNLFATWEWNEAWWRHFGHGRLLLTACRAADGALVALLPLYRSAHRPLRTIRFIGHGPADQLGPISAPAHATAAAGALKRMLAGPDPGWDLFLGDDLPAEPEWQLLTGARALYRTPTPVLDLKGRDWEEFLMSRSRNFRQQVRRFERRLEREHRVRYRLIEDPEHLPEAMSTLFSLHEARWGGATRAFGGRLAHFHRDFAAEALRAGWLRLLFLEVDGRPVAALHNFRFAGCEYVYQTGRDPAYERWSVGFLLWCRSIRSAMEDGLAEYRFLRGAEAYKWRFATRDPGVVTVGLAKGGPATVALSGARHAPHLPRPIRHRLPAPLTPWPRSRGATRDEAPA